MVGLLGLNLRVWSGHAFHEKHLEMTLCWDFKLKLTWLSLCPVRCVPLSDPAAIPDTPRGRGSQPLQKEEKAKQEESLSLFDLLPAPQAVWGGSDRHSGQCRLRGPKLWDSSLTRVPTKPLGVDQTDLPRTNKKIQPKPSLLPLPS